MSHLEMLVMIGRETTETRAVHHIDITTGRRVPELRYDEEAVFGIDGSVYIVETARKDSGEAKR